VCRCSRCRRSAPPSPVVISPLRGMPQDSPFVLPVDRRMTYSTETKGTGSVTPRRTLQARFCSPSPRLPPLLLEVARGRTETRDAGSTDVQSIFISCKCHRRAHTHTHTHTEKQTEKERERESVHAHVRK